VLVNTRENRDCRRLNLHIDPQRVPGRARRLRIARQEPGNEASGEFLLVSRLLPGNENRCALSLSAPWRRGRKMFADLDFY
jgi:hypothetical protein